jgi:hypothetical protein
VHFGGTLRVLGKAEGLAEGLGGMRELSRGGPPRSERLPLTVLGQDAHCILKVVESVYQMLDGLLDM